MKPPAFIQENVLLGKMTTFGIGGPARWFSQPVNRRELVETLLFARDQGVEVKTLGGGSNLLVADEGIDAVVIRLDGAGEFGEIIHDPNEPLAWQVGAAVPLARLVAETTGMGVAGLETFAGIPGHVGGAAAMNAGGGTGDGIGQFVEQAEVYTLDGEPLIITKKDLQFSYRNSALRGLLATDIYFRFTMLDNPVSLSSKMREYRERKRAGQPLTVPSAGCVFKNPQGDSAGSLLDLSGCKGWREGGAEVSRLHANFIVNHGNATACDVVRLANRMREAVKQSYGIVLEPELMLWGFSRENCLDAE